MNRYKTLISILSFLFLITSCGNAVSDIDKNLEKTNECKTGEMTPAMYEFGMDEDIPNIHGVEYGFIILVDTNNKATNFISAEEDFSRESSIELDTNNINWRESWKKLSIKQKLDRLKYARKSYIIEADSIHAKNNNGQQQVWIINNSQDTISIQMQDGSYICVLQAKTKSGKWQPIQYWRFSSCGNSYYYKYFPPKTANSFITKIPTKGDYKTKLRYKLLGANKFYYSNEFEGKINYCEFVEDIINYLRISGKIKPHYKLDSLIKVARY